MSAVEEYLAEVDHERPTFVAVTVAARRRRNTRGLGTAKGVAVVALVAGDAAGFSAYPVLLAALFVALVAGTLVQLLPRFVARLSAGDEIVDG